jgi:hypothetical protein
MVNKYGTAEKYWYYSQQWLTKLYFIESREPVITNGV